MSSGPGAVDTGGEATGMAVADRSKRVSEAFTGPGSKLSLAAAVSVLISGLGTVGRYALQVALTQVLGAGGFGLYITLRRWAETVAAFPNLGYRGAVVRLLPDYVVGQRWSYYRGLVRHSLRLTLIGGMALAVVASLVGWWHWPDHRLAAVAAMVAIPAWAVFRTADSLLVARHQFVAASSVDQLLQPGIMGVGLLALWLLGQEIGVDAVIVAVSISALVAAGADLWFLARNRPDEMRLAEAAGERVVETDVGRWQPVAWQFYAHQLSSTVINSADILILSLFVSFAEVGLYGAASRIAILARVVNSGVESIVAPRIASSWAARNMAALQRNVDKAIAVSAPPTIFLVIVLIVAGRPLLRIMGPEFVEGNDLMMILLIGIAVQALTGPCGHVVALTDNERFNARTMMVAALALIVACFVAAPLAGKIGVAVAVAVVNVGWNLVLTGFAQRKLGIKTYPNFGMKETLALPDWARRGSRR